jgi:hypothetical protein
MYFIVTISMLNTSDESSVQLHHFDSKILRPSMEETKGTGIMPKM